MSIFTFGLHRSVVDPKLVSRVRRLIRTATLDGAVASLLEEPGLHVLPHLQGNPRGQPAVRRRYLALVKEAVPIAELRAALRRELPLLISGAPPEVQDGDSDDPVIVGESIDCNDSWMPRWLCEKLNEPPDDEEEPPDDDDDEDDDDDVCPENCIQCSTLGSPTGEFDCWEVQCDNAPWYCKIFD
jgi:hypothetical protein